MTEPRMHYTFFKTIKEIEKVYFPESRDDSTFEITETFFNVMFLQTIKDSMVKDIKKGANPNIESGVTFQALMSHFMNNYESWENAEKPFERANKAEELIKLYNQHVVKRQKKAVFERSVILGIFIGTAIGFAFCRFI